MTTEEKIEKKILERQKRKAYREYLSDLRHDRRSIGVKFYDAKGSGRIVNVIEKIHGGGATDRKRKLLDKQKKGKQRLRTFGKVDIPQEAFIAALKVE